MDKKRKHFYLVKNRYDVDYKRVEEPPSAIVDLLSDSGKEVIISSDSCCVKYRKVLDRRVGENRNPDNDRRSLRDD